MGLVFDILLPMADLIIITMRTTGDKKLLKHTLEL